MRVISVALSMCVCLGIVGEVAAAGKVTFDDAVRSEKAWRDQYKQQSLSNEESKRLWNKYNSRPPEENNSGSNSSWTRVWSQPFTSGGQQISVPIPDGIVKEGHLYMILVQGSSGKATTGAPILAQGGCWKKTVSYGCRGSISDDDPWGIYTNSLTRKVTLTSNGRDGLKNSKITALYEMPAN